jgi:hypothetical protein
MTLENCNSLLSKQQVFQSDIGIPLGNPNKKESLLGRTILMGMRK